MNTNDATGKEATEPDSDSENAGTPPVHPNTLTRFQVDALAAIARYQARQSEPPHGTAIKEKLEKRYDEEVHHGRLYPNLDTLVDLGLIGKEAADLRTNHYSLTQLGAHALDERVGWLADSGGEE